jgi:hypothetical protein
MHIFPHTGLPILGLKDLTITQIGECTEISLEHKHHIASAAPIAARGAPEGDKFLTPKGDTPVAPFTARHGDERFIGEFDHFTLPRR